MTNWVQKNPFKYPTFGVRTCKDQLPAMFLRNEVWYIGYPKNTDDELWHTAQSVPIYAARVDIAYPKLLVRYEHQEIRDVALDECRMQR
jgi:hypothetical protein